MVHCNSPTPPPPHPLPVHSQSIPHFDYTFVPAAPTNSCWPGMVRPVTATPSLPPACFLHASCMHSLPCLHALTEGLLMQQRWFVFHTFCEYNQLYCHHSSYFYLPFVSSPFITPAGHRSNEVLTGSTHLGIVECIVCSGQGIHCTMYSRLLFMTVRWNSDMISPD